MNIEFTYKHTLSSLTKFTFWFIYVNNKYWIKQLLALIILLAYVAFCIIRQDVNLIILFVVISSNLFLLYLPLVALLRARKEYQTNKTWALEIKYLIDDNMIKLETGEQFSQFNWDSIVKVHETKEYFYLIIANSNAIIVPKSLLGDRLALFRQLLAEKLTPEQKKHLKK